MKILIMLALLLAASSAAANPGVVPDGHPSSYADKPNAGDKDSGCEGCASADAGSTALPFAILLGLVAKKRRNR